MKESESLNLFGQEELDSLCGKTWPERLLPMTVETFMRSFSRFETSGLILSGGGCWTGNTLESPNPADECSLSQILEEIVPERYFVTPRQAAYMLRRSKAMKWDYGERITTELSMLAAQADGDAPIT